MDKPGKLLSVSTILRDLLYVTYLVPSFRVRSLVPAALPLATVQEDRVFVSVVLLTCSSIGPFTFPWIPARFHQLNIRTYVRHPATGEIGIFFFTSAITSRLMLVIPRMLRLPLESARLSMDIKRADGEGVSCYRVSGSFRGEILVEGHQTDSSVGSIEPFTGERETLAYLIEPTVAYFKRNTATGFLRASHKHTDPSVIQITGFRFPYLTSSAMVGEANLNTPRNALFVREATFVLFPPRKLKA